MRPPIGIGLIGVGRHGIRYARHLVQDVVGARLIAVCRQHPEQPLGLPGTESVTMYREAEALIQDPSVDVVIAVTPPVLSRAICLQAVRARKPVLIEKPLSVSAEDARVMVETAGQAGVPLMTGHTLRFDATIQALSEKRALVGRSQQLVLTIHVETRLTRPAHADGYGGRGALLEIGVHLLDLVRFLTRDNIREARCTMDVAPPAAPETLASVHLVTHKGTDCTIDVRRVAAGRKGTIMWAGADGRLTADWVDQRLEWIPMEQGTEGRTETWMLSPRPTVLATMEAFLEAIRDNRTMPITGEDGLRAIEIADVCYRSAQAGGRAISLPYV